MSSPGFRRLSVLSAPDIAEHPVLGVLAHGTGIEKDEIRFLGNVGKTEAHPGEQALHVLRVGHVLLTAVGTDTGKWRRPVADTIKRADLLDIRLLPGQLLRAGSF